MELTSGIEDVTVAQSVVHHFTGLLVQIVWSRTTIFHPQNLEGRMTSLLNEMSIGICAFYLCLNNLELERLGSSFINNLKGEVKNICLKSPDSRLSREVQQQLIKNLRLGEA